MRDGKLLYHQMLVSPHVGGGEKLALEIHRHSIVHRGPVGQLVLPPGGDAEKVALREKHRFITYNIQGLFDPNLLASIAENIHIYYRTKGYRRGVIHVHSPFVYGAMRPFLVTSRMRKLLHIHLDYTAEQLRWAFNCPPDLVLVCAEFMRGAVEAAVAQANAKRTRIRVLRNGVDIERFFPADPRTIKSRFSLDPDVPLVLMVANLAPHKGQETAIRSVALLRHLGWRSKLWLAGEEREQGAGYRRKLKALCGELEVDGLVEFLGFRNDIPELMRAADFLLLPSTSEGLPLVILEAQASQSLVLAAPTAGIPEVVEDDQTGYLIPADDYEGYAERMAMLLRNPAQRKYVEANAYKLAKSMSLDRYCAAVLDEYDHLLHGC